MIKKSVPHDTKSAIPDLALLSAQLDLEKKFKFVKEKKLHEVGIIKNSTRCLKSKGPSIWDVTRFVARNKIFNRTSHKNSSKLPITRLT